MAAYNYYFLFCFHKCSSCWNKLNCLYFFFLFLCFEDLYDIPSAGWQWREEVENQRALLKGTAKSLSRLLGLRLPWEVVQEVHSLIAQGSQNNTTLINSESLHKTGRKNKKHLCAKELDEKELTAWTGSMRTVKGE